MNYIRSTNNNSSNQNIRLAMNLDNPLVTEMLNSLSAKLLNKQKETEKWGVWSEGNISFGRIGQQDGNLGQDIHSDGITFGIDKRINEDNQTKHFHCLFKSRNKPIRYSMKSDLTCTNQITT